MATSARQLTDDELEKVLNLAKMKRYRCTTCTEGRKHNKHK